MDSSNSPVPTPTPQRGLRQIRYRVWQLWRALTGRISASEAAFARDTLTPAEHALFCAMPPYDRRHTLDVALLLHAEGQRDPALLAVALLHDIGKVADDGRPLGLGWYGVGVVLRRFPRLLGVAQWGSASLRRLAVHEQRSVDAAVRAGARPAVVALLTALAAGSADPLLRVFHEADDRC